MDLFDVASEPLAEGTFQVGAAARRGGQKRGRDV